MQSFDAGSRGVTVIHRAATSRRAFTLFELVVTIAIIALLAGLVAPAVFRNVGDAKVSAARSQIEMLSTALSAYRLDTDAFPLTEQGLATLRRAQDVLGGGTYRATGAGHI